MQTGLSAFAGILAGCSVDRAPTASYAPSHDYRDYIPRRIRDVQTGDSHAAREMIGYGKANARGYFTEQRAAKPSAAKDMKLEIEVWDPYATKPLSNVEVNVLGNSYRTGSDGVARISTADAAPKPAGEELMLIIPGGQVTTSGGLALTQPRPKFYSVVDNPNGSGRYRYPLLEYFEEDGVDINTAMVNLGIPPPPSRVSYPVKVYINPKIVKVTNRSDPFTTVPTENPIKDLQYRMVRNGIDVWQNYIDQISQKTSGPRKAIAEFVDNPDVAEYVYEFAEDLRSTDFWDNKDGKRIAYIDSYILDENDSVAPHITGHILFGYQHEIAPGIQVGMMGQSRPITEMEARITYLGMNTEDLPSARIFSIDSYSGLLELPEDFDGGGNVDFSDFFEFADAFGTSSRKYDLDGDGIVGFGDFFMFADAFGKTKAYQELYKPEETLLQ